MAGVLTQGPAGGSLSLVCDAGLTTSTSKVRRVEIDWRARIHKWRYIPSQKGRWGARSAKLARRRGVGEVDDGDHAALDPPLTDRLAIRAGPSLSRVAPSLISTCSTSTVERSVPRTLGVRHKLFRESEPPQYL